MIEARAYPAIAPAENRSPIRSVGIGLAVGLSVVVLAALCFAGNAQLLRGAIPIAALLVALALYFIKPVLYIQYSLWVWFLAPLARRIVDWKFGYTDPNLVLLAPFLVSGVAGLTLVLPGRRKNIGLPAVFVLCIAAILYGFVVGIVVRPSAETVYGLLNWLCPLLFGVHIYSNWPSYEEHRRAISRTLLWALLILGLYGIYQFFLPPTWDRIWLENGSIGQISPSFGQPEPLRVRVWSTMNSPAPFANAMMAGLLLLLMIRSTLKLPAAVAGYLAFLLSMVRTAWLGWLIGFFLMLKNINPRVIIRIFLSAVVLLVCLLPLLSDPRLAMVIGDRVKTFMDLGHDESFGDRLEMYRVLVNDAAGNPFGHGLKNLEVSHGIPVDSGVLVMFFSLGWLGTLLYALGITSLFLKNGPRPEMHDQFYNAAKAIVIAMLAQLIGANIFVNVTGAIFWTFTGMRLAASPYHAQERAGPNQLQPSE
jgi:hypothetical protein